MPGRNGMAESTMIRAPCSRWNMCSEAYDQGSSSFASRLPKNTHAPQHGVSVYWANSANQGANPSICEGARMPLSPQEKS